MARNATEAATAEILGVTAKTLFRWRTEPKDGRPVVPHRMVGKRPFYDPPEVQQWMTEWGVTGARPGSSPPVARAAAATPGPAPAAPSPDAGAAHSEAKLRLERQRAGAGAAMLKSREAQRQAEIRKASAELEVWDKIPKMTTDEEHLAIVLELVSLNGKGLLPDGALREARELLTEARQSLKLRKKSPTAGTLERALVVTTETIPLVTAFEGITDAGRRARALAFVLAIADEDRALGPRPDTGEAQEAVA